MKPTQQSQILANLKPEQRAAVDAQIKAQPRRKIAIPDAYAPVCGTAPVFLVLPYPVSTNDNWKWTPTGMRLSDESIAYKETVGKIGMIERVRPFSCEVSVLVRAYRKNERCDPDNLFKNLLDSMEGVCYHNDNQIRHLETFIDDDKDRPRVEVWIAPFTLPEIIPAIQVSPFVRSEGAKP